MGGVLDRERSSHTEVDAALALVCALPAVGRDGRRVDVYTVVSQATSVSGSDRGVELAFPNTDDMAQVLLELALAERNCCARFQYSIAFPPNHASIELRIEAEGGLIKPLQALYLGLAGTADAHD